MWGGAKDRFEQEVGNISSTEIAEIEQTLIDEGLSPEEIKKFCNVHTLLFQSALEKSASEETFPSHLESSVIGHTPASCLPASSNLSTRARESVSV